MSRDAQIFSSTSPHQPSPLIGLVANSQYCCDLFWNSHRISEISNGRLHGFRRPSRGAEALPKLPG